jgi:hypothetical protein
MGNFHKHDTIFSFLIAIEEEKKRNYHWKQMLLIEIIVKTINKQKTVRFIKC